MTIPLPYKPYSKPSIENILREIDTISIELEEKDPKNSRYLKDTIAWFLEHMEDKEDEIKELKAELKEAYPAKYKYI